MGRYDTATGGDRQCPNPSGTALNGTRKNISLLPPGRKPCCRPSGRRSKWIFTAGTASATFPENLDYDSLFDDIFAQYTENCTLNRVKTSNMGTLYELEYAVILPGDTVPKAFLDALRCRNGNLNITCGRESTPALEVL